VSNDRTVLFFVVVLAVVVQGACITSVSRRLTALEVAAAKTLVKLECKRVAVKEVRK